MAGVTPNRPAYSLLDEAALECDWLTGVKTGRRRDSLLRSIRYSLLNVCGQVVVGAQ